MWFITRARERYRTKSREERLYFREAGWQRKQQPPAGGGPVKRPGVGVILATGNLRHMDREFKASLGYSLRLT